jgi:putative glutamine amidotransferase
MPSDSPGSGARPLIAVTGSDQAARWGAWDEVATLVPSAYMRAVKEAGGVPAVVAPTAEADEIAARVDGVVLTGGGDVDPALYGEQPHPQTQQPDPERDTFEMSLIDACTSRGVPVLAVCRGLQVVNVARGGTLFQHLPDTVGTSVHLPTPGSFGRHWVQVEPTSHLGRIVGRERLEVPTHHHQGIDKIGKNLLPTAWAEDGIVEAAEDPDLEFLVAVQWHPEAGGDRRLFEALVAAASS